MKIDTTQHNSSRSSSRSQESNKQTCNDHIDPLPESNECAYVHQKRFSTCVTFNQALNERKTEKHIQPKIDNMPDSSQF